MTTDVELMVIGRTSSWATRLPILDRRQRQGTQDRNEHALLSTWLRGRGCGAVGVYLAPDLMLTSGERSRGQWLEVAGRVQPRLVHALPDDPRSAHIPDAALLFLEVLTLRPVQHRRQVEQPRLALPQQVRLLPPYRAGPGFLASLARWPDVLFWQLGARPPAISASWNAVRGVETQLEDTRYLRYILTLAHTGKKEALSG
jgi:hypothetical protein